MSTLISGTAFGAGIASHLLYFKQNEHHLYPVRYMQAFLLTVATVAIARTQYYDTPLKQSFSSSFSVGGTFLAGLFTSLLIYRLFFNPLNKIPGPYFARVSKFNSVFRNAKLDGHHQIQRLHEKHGKFVRIGPNDISVTHPDGAEVISGVKSKCIKAAWYDQDYPIQSLHTTRERAIHDRRRRVWAPAFSDKALRGYESRIQVYNDLLIKQIAAYAGKPLNATKWFNLYSFDVMGDLGFGSPFNMLESGEEHWAIKLLNEGMDPLGLWFPAWFFRFLISIPGLTAGYHKFIRYCADQIENRAKTHPEKKDMADKDVAHYLVEHFNTVEDKALALHMLHADSRLIIVAGSDTTAATLTHLFYHLCRDPSLLQRLREELKPLVGSDSATHQQIQDAPFLNGCIHETLRLNPPVPSGVFRMTPKEGVDIGGTFVPGDTTIQMPGYVMGHDESIYPSAEEFLPERWYSRPEMLPHKDAWQPFSSGPFGCIGRNLAMIEVRLLTTNLLMDFDVKFAPGEDGSKLLKESTDHFTLGLAPLELVFTKRK